jgi:hypothetical protein
MSKQASQLEEGVMAIDEEEESQKFKKVVHFVEEHGEGHIELKDLSENDFLELIEGKN